MNTSLGDFGASTLLTLSLIKFARLLDVFITHLQSKGPRSTETFNAGPTTSAWRLQMQPKKKGKRDHSVLEAAAVNACRILRIIRLWR